MYHLVIDAIYIHLFLGNTPHVILGTQRPISPISEIGTGLTWWSIHFNRVVINPLFFILYSLSSILYLSKSYLYVGPY